MYEDPSCDEALGSSLSDTFSFFPLPPRISFKSPPETELAEKCNQRRLSVRELKIIRSEGGVCGKRDRRAEIKALWRLAYQSVLKLKDPWAVFHLEQFPVEEAKRYRYNALKGDWVEDVICIKMQPTSFGRGAMRECFRAKKLSNFSQRHSSSDWSHAGNFVAKRYLEKYVSREVYFDDVRLQMDAKLWGEEYSRDPSVIKKVDIAQMCVIEFTNRPNQPCYHLEHFIEGNYRKYNSNSGFVDSMARNTPQAFSHFTFERSEHRLIVVDIQGVGDLWTDPQVHTFDGKVYGDGNLGLRGMALFFHTHRCNAICESLQLDVFDLAPDEQALSSLTIKSPSLHLVNNGNNQANGNGHAVANGGDRPSSIVVGNGSRRRRKCQEPKQFEELFGQTVAIPRERVHSGDSESSSMSPGGFYPSTGDNFNVDPLDFDDSPLGDRLPYLPIGSNTPHRDSPHFEALMSQDSGIEGVERRGSAVRRQYTNGRKNSTETSEDGIMRGRSLSGSSSLLANRLMPPLITSANSSFKGSYETEMAAFIEAHRIAQRSSSVVGLRNQDSDAFILGLVHHELARMHSLGRFSAHSTANFSVASNSEEASVLDAVKNPPLDINWSAVIFHEEQAAALRCCDAIECLAQYYLGLPINGPLADCPQAPDPDEARLIGLTYISTAASSGDRTSMCYLADMHYSGLTLLPSEQVAAEPDWAAAYHWYDEAAKLHNSDSTSPQPASPLVKQQRGGSILDDQWPIHKMYGRMADMLASGRHGLEQDLARAYELYEAAAEAASEAMLGAAAMRFYDKAAELEEYASVEC